MLEIQVIQGSILEAAVEAIVNAANSHGIMGGGVAGVIRCAAGPAVEQEALGQAPIPIGKAVLTSGGTTKYKGIIHAPTMPEPAMRIPAINVGHATKAALRVADERRFSSIAIPGMGTGVGGVSHDEAAAQMIREIRAFTPRSLRSVVLVDVDAEMVRAWTRRLEQP